MTPRRPNRARSLSTPWAPYQPSADAPWNLRRVVHLHRRAGFAANWSELQRDLEDGPTAAVDRLLAGTSCRAAVPEEFESTAARLAEAALSGEEPARLKAWWAYRMLLGPDPLGERLTLFWHGQFATSLAKVRDLRLMHRQNETFRRLARAPLSEILNASVREPALLLYLDAPSNRKGRPNENLARELMELFTLGVGHYSESDVKGVARALIGWTVQGDRFVDDAVIHDMGEKSILDRKGPWAGSDVLSILLEHPATAERLADRLCHQFLGEGTVDRAAITELADGLRTHGLDVSWGVETILRSSAFFAEADLGGRIVSPVEFVIGAARALATTEAVPSTLLLAEWAKRLGQDLFEPPNVAGWPGGRAWLTHRGIIGRGNFANALVDGDLSAGRRPLDLLGLAARHGRAGGPGSAATFVSELLLGTPDRNLGTPPLVDDQTVRRAITRLLASAEAQLS